MIITKEEIGQRIDETLKHAMNSDGMERLKNLDDLIVLTDKRNELSIAS